MIRLNKHLKGLGIKETDFPFEKHSPKDDRYKNNEEGFSEAEFFNLHYTLDLIIYSYLKEFEEEYSHFGHPMGLTPKQWRRILHTMVKAFELSISTTNNFDWEKDEQTKAIINRGRKLFMEYYYALWW